MAEPAQSRKGPWTQRVLVHFFTVCLTVLIYWLLGFLMDDIRTWPGPDFAAMETRLLDPKVVEQSKNLAVKMEETQRQIKDEGERQRILRESTQSSQETMRQLMEIQRLGLQKDVTPTAEEQKALADAETLFLTNQKRSQEINEKVATLDEQLRELQTQNRGVDEKLQAGRVEVQREFESQRQRHDLKMAFVSLAALSPFLALAAWLFFKHRSSLYSPMIYAYGLAVLLKIAAVMHEYFPSRYFKYVLILVCLAAVVKALATLLRAIAHPRREWLLKQYREAYESFLCPVCEYPIRRGPMKFLSWTRRSLRRLPILRTDSEAKDEPYTCPMCSTSLYEECSACHATRHSLLPACVHCGSDKPIAGIEGPASAAT